MTSDNALHGLTIISTTNQLLAENVEQCVNALHGLTIISTEWKSIDAHNRRECQCPTRANDYFYINEKCYSEAF